MTSATTKNSRSRGVRCPRPPRPPFPTISSLSTALVCTVPKKHVDRPHSIALALNTYGMYVVRISRPRKGVLLCVANQLRPFFCPRRSPHPTTNFLLVPSFPARQRSSRRRKTGRSRKRARPDRCVGSSPSCPSRPSCVLLCCVFIEENHEISDGTSSDFRDGTYSVGSIKTIFHAAM